ncbi:hypothetical protein [Pseudomonas chlororaphis]|uniref:hypothetical protein n=1 Tax=Pseudomonas chlororaphis TaxID=587753 RepID=UPI002407CE14|nr:hypothetical protein [Pseudomonas chlororaphis]
MLIEFSCTKCNWTKREPLGDDLKHSGICRSCSKLSPPMRTPSASLKPSAGSMLVVVVFLLGVALGAKMTGGW